MRTPTLYLVLCTLYFYLLSQQIHNSSTSSAGLLDLNHPVVGSHRHFFSVVGTIPTHIRIFGVEHPCSTSLVHGDARTFVKANFWNTPCIVEAISIGCKGVVDCQGIEVWTCSSDIKELIQGIAVPVGHADNDVEFGLSWSALCTVPIQDIVLYVEVLVVVSRPIQVHHVDVVHWIIHHKGTYWDKEGRRTSCKGAVVNRHISW